MTMQELGEKLNGASVRLTYEDQHWCALLRYQGRPYVGVDRDSIVGAIERALRRRDELTGGKILD